TGELPDAALRAEKTRFEDQLVTRHHRLAEAQLVGTNKVIQGAIARFGIHHLETEQAGCLRHGLDDQDTRHDRMLGKMTIEKRLVDSDILVGTNALVFHIERYHAIHQQKRVTVWQVFANFVDVHHV